MVIKVVFEGVGNFQRRDPLFVPPTVGQKGGLVNRKIANIFAFLRKNSDFPTMSTPTYIHAPDAN